jgi:putative addiction module killer protein
MGLFTFLSIRGKNKIRVVVDNTPIKVIAFKRSNGDCPFVDWLQEIKDTKMRLSILKRLQRLKVSNLGDYKSLGGNLFELRMEILGGVRIYFTKEGNTVVVLLCAGNKRTQKKDITKARAYMTLYEGGDNAEHYIA